MRITLLLERLEPARGGAEAYAASWAAWLAAQGVAVGVATLFPFAESAWLAKPPQVTVRSLDRLGSDVVENARRLEALARQDGGLLHDFGAGLGGDLFQPLFGLRATAQRGERQALGLRGSLRYFRRHARRRELQRLEAAQVAGGGLLIACSRRVASDFGTAHGLDESRLRLLPNAIDSRGLSPATPAQRAAARIALGLPSDGTVFLQVAHNFRLKGVATAIRALARLRGQQPAVHLLVVGRGPDRRTFRKLARRLGIADRVHLAGALPSAQIAFQAADALVHPALYDACSLVSLEALAAGLPLALSAEDGSSELITDGVQGWLIRDPRDVGEVAFQMKRLLDPGLRGAMGAQARVLALHSERRDAFRRLLGFAEEAAARRR